ncbi:adenine phosphoribosyltransferase [soil metagenome]
MAATDDLARFIRDVPDFPQPGVVFKDISPLLADPGALAAAVQQMAEPHRGTGITKVVGIEARGFIFAAPVAIELGAGFVPLRKAGKLPAETVAVSYALEYGEAVLEVHADAFQPGDRVLIIDDVLATGGTAQAAMTLVEQAGGQVAGLSFVIELGFLDGAAALRGAPWSTLLSL